MLGIQIIWFHCNKMFKLKNDIALQTCITLAMALLFLMANKATY